MRNFFTIVIGSLFSTQIFATPIDVDVSAGTSGSVPSDLIGINSANSEFTSTSPEEDVIQIIIPGGIRYPDGLKANYWDHSYWEATSDQRMASGDPGTGTPFDGYVVDEDKHDPGSPFPSPLDEAVDIADPNGMTITFICNMATPGADYFYHKDSGDSKAYTDDPPARADAYPDNPYTLPSSASDYTITRDNDLWWDHMKRRVAACIHMLDDAVVNEGLSASDMRVELGNEFYWAENPYVFEVFPPDMDEWDRALCGDATNDMGLSTNKYSHEGYTYGVECNGSYQPSYKVYDCYYDTEPDPDNWTCTSTASAAVVDGNGDCYAFNEDTMSLAKYIKECKFDKGNYGHFSGRRITPTFTSGNDFKISSNFTMEELAGDLAYHIPPSDSYARAAIYFADAIKSYTRDSTQPYEDVEIAAIKAASIIGYTKEARGKPYWNASASVYSYISLWDKIILEALEDLDATYPTSSSSTVLIDAATKHSYAVSPTSWDEDNLNMDTTGGLLEDPDEEDDPVGEIVRSIYTSVEYTQRYGDSDCYDQDCLTTPYPLWHTEYAFDYKNQLVYANGDDRFEYDALLYDDSWIRGLGTSYMMHLLLENQSSEKLQYYDAQTVSDVFNDGTVVIDSAGLILQGWALAAESAIAREILSFTASTQSDLDLDNSDITPHASCGATGIPCISPSGKLIGVYGVKFTNSSTGTTRYLITNLLNEELDVTLDLDYEDDSYIYVTAESDTSGSESGLKDLPDVSDWILMGSLESISMPPRSAMVVDVGCTASSQVDTDDDGVVDDCDTHPNDDSAASDSDGDGYLDEWIEPNDKSCTGSQSTCGALELDAYPEDPAQH